MLARRDTLIAFAVLMLGISLIVMILTQTVSAFFGLRGTNLLWGVRMLLKTIGPGLESQAEAILTHPVISDSVASRMFAPFCGHAGHRVARAAMDAGIGHPAGRTRAHALVTISGAEKYRRQGRHCCGGPDRFGPGLCRPGDGAQDSHAQDGLSRSGPELRAANR
jgi:hypothetical protein